MKDVANALDEPFAEAIDLHRLWAGMVNEILVCRLADISAWQNVDSGAEKAFSTAVGRLASARQVTALQATAALIKESTRHSDMVFRYGGEEFLICMPGLSLAAGKRHIEKMRQQIAASPIGCEAEQMISITVSFGVCELAGNRSVADVLKLADKALYRAKAAGRNRVEVG